MGLSLVVMCKSCASHGNFLIVLETEKFSVLLTLSNICGGRYYPPATLYCSHFNRGGASWVETKWQFIFDILKSPCKVFLIFYYYKLFRTTLQKLAVRNFTEFFWNSQLRGWEVSIPDSGPVDPSSNPLGSMNFFFILKGSKALIITLWSTLMVCHF